MKSFFRNTLLLFIIMNTAGAHGQLTVNILVPPSGMVDKQQLWNIILTNTDPTSLSIQVQASFSELSTGQPVFTASTGSMIIGTGTKQLTAATIGQVQYNSVNGNYRIDPGPTGLLPVGSFSVCYSFLIEKYNKVVQECQPVNIPPLGPLLLNQPSNGSNLKEFHPMFSWLPLSTGQSLTNLKYDLRLVEVLPNQSAADAMLDNAPLFVSHNLSAANYLYTPSAPQLLPGKQYAWRVIATNNLSEITKSETWSFTTNEETPGKPLPLNNPTYIKLKKAGAQDGYAVFNGNIRFDYFNETSDTSWNVQIEDLSNARHVSFALSLDNVKLAKGQNLVNYPAAEDKRFIHGHQYLLRVMNSNNEAWQIRFTYRKQD
jgi:hypothetical protein